MPKTLVSLLTAVALLAGPLPAAVRVTPDAGWFCYITPWLCR